jgi:membrane-associated phospholipid phosphatase
VVIDRQVGEWFVDHRSKSIRSFARLLTELGGGTGLALAVAGALLIGMCSDNARDVVVVSQDEGNQLRERLNRRLWRGAGNVVIVVLGALTTSVVVSMLKHGIGRARPPQAWRLVFAPDSAMPSGHAAKGAVLAVILTWLWRVQRTPSQMRKNVVTVVAFAFAGVVGGTRIVLGVHWVSDVAAGWIVGAFIGVVTIGALRRMQARSLFDRDE